MLKKYIATLQVLINADTRGEACDAVSNLLHRDDGVDTGIFDWSYCHQSMPVPPCDEFGFCSPAETQVSEDYQEGDAFQGEIDAMQ